MKKDKIKLEDLHYATRRRMEDAAFVRTPKSTESFIGLVENLYPAPTVKNYGYDLEDCKWGWFHLFKKNLSKDSMQWIVDKLKDDFVKCKTKQEAIKQFCPKYKGKYWGKTFVLRFWDHPTIRAERKWDAEWNTLPEKRKWYFQFMYSHGRNREIRDAKRILCINTSLNPWEIPDDLAEAKVEQLKLKREIKKHENNKH